MKVFENIPQLINQITEKSIYVTSDIEPYLCQNVTENFYKMGKCGIAKNQ